MPLPSVANRQGPAAIYPPDETVTDLFATLGTAFEVEEEDEFDALCAATATIASYFAFADSIASWLVGQGVPPGKAREYVARMFWALGNTAVNAPERSFQSFAGDHATPGGINEQVLTHLVEHRTFEIVFRWPERSYAQDCVGSAEALIESQLRTVPRASLLGGGAAPC